MLVLAGCYGTKAFCRECQQTCHYRRMLAGDELCAFKGGTIGKRTSGNHPRKSVIRRCTNKSSRNSRFRMKRLFELWRLDLLTAWDEIQL